MTCLARNEKVTDKTSTYTLQDLLLTEAALIVGLISTMTGDALQDDIALTILGLRRRGQDILSGNTTPEAWKCSNS
jgi:hypothetical protein